MAWLRVCLIGLIAALALLLGACGNREPEARALHRAAAEPQRGRRRRTGRPGARKNGRRWAITRKPTASCRTTRPSCAAAQPLREVLATETLRSVGDIVARRDALTLARKTLQANVAAVREARARADKARSSLELPPDLAPAYDGVYDESPDRPRQRAAGRGRHAGCRGARRAGYRRFRGGERCGHRTGRAPARVATPSLQQALNLRLQGLNAQSDDLERAREQIRRAVGPSLTDPAATPSAGAASTPATGVVSAPAAGSVAAPAAVRR